MKKYFYLIKDYLNIALSALIPDTYQLLGKCDVLLCCHDADRGDSLDGLPYSKLIDTVFEDLTDKGWICHQFALPFSVLTGMRAWGKPASANQKYLYFLISKKIRKTFPFLSHLALSKTETLLPIESFYHELFELTQPRCVIAIGSPVPMCRVAKSKGIPVIELLHGIGYASLPWGWDKQPSRDLPSGILSLDDISTKTFVALSSQGVEVRQIPHPFFRRFLNEESRKKLPLEWQRKPDWLPDGKIIILVSLQWGYDGDHGSYTEFADILKNGLIPNEVIDAVEQTYDSVFWLFRLHPVQLRMTKYKHHRRFLDRLTQKHPNCEWCQSSMLPLHLILSYCNGHMTMSSMTAYDAAFMAVKTLLMCPRLQPNGPKSDYFHDLIESGFAELGSFDTDEIVKWVTTVSRSSHICTINANSDADWNSAVEWMLGRAGKAEL